MIYIERSRAHFGLWALLKAPLLIGADLRRIGEAHLNVLLDKEVIMINQDGLGVAGDLIYTHGAVQVFAAPLEGGSRAVGVLHRQTSGMSANVTVELWRLGYPEHLPVSVRNVFAQQTWPRSMARTISVEVLPASLQLLRLSPHIGFLCGESDSVRTLGDDLDTLSDTYGEVECVSKDKLEAWRPWDHGFFG